MPTDGQPVDYTLSWTLDTGETYKVTLYRTNGGQDHTVQAMEMLRDGLNAIGTNNVRLTEKRNIELDMSI